MLSLKAGEGDYITSIFIIIISFFLVMKYDWPAPIIIVTGGLLFLLKHAFIGKVLID